MNPELAEFAKYGIGGLAILILGFCVFIFKAYHKIVSNHINHSTEAMTNNTNAIVNLADVIKDFKNEIRSRS